MEDGTLLPKNMLCEYKKSNHPIFLADTILSQSYPGKVYGTLDRRTDDVIVD